MAFNSCLLDKTIITTQQADSAHQLIKLLSEKGARALHIPMIRTHILQLKSKEIEILKNLNEFDLLVFTSKSGVRGFFENLHTLQEGSHIPKKLQIAAIGQGTADEVAMRGHRVTYMNPGKDVGDLAAFINEEVLKGGERVLLSLGNLASAFLEKELAKTAYVTRIDVYRTDPIIPQNYHDQNLVNCQQADICIFSSPSGFQTYLKYYNLDVIPKFAAIGNTTADCIMSEGYNVEVVAPYPSATAMVEALEEYFRVLEKDTRQS